MRFKIGLCDKYHASQIEQVDRLGKIAASRDRAKARARAKSKAKANEMSLVSVAAIDSYQSGADWPGLDMALAKTLASAWIVHFMSMRNCQIIDRQIGQQNESCPLLQIALPLILSSLYSWLSVGFDSHQKTKAHKDTIESLFLLGSETNLKPVEWGCSRLET